MPAINELSIDNLRAICAQPLNTLFRTVYSELERTPSTVIARIHARGTLQGFQDYPYFLAIIEQPCGLRGDNTCRPIILLSGAEKNISTPIIMDPENCTSE